MYLLFNKSGQVQVLVGCFAALNKWKEEEWILWRHLVKSATQSFISTEGAKEGGK